MTPQKCIEWNLAFSAVGKIIQSAFWTKIIDENQNFLWGRMRNCISWTSARCVWKIGRTNLAAQIRKSFSLLWKIRIFQPSFLFLKTSLKPSRLDKTYKNVSWWWRQSQIWTLIFHYYLFRHFHLGSNILFSDVRED